MAEERPTDEDKPAAAEAKIVRTQELFGPDKEIVIDHDGEKYRLRITRRGKLILQK
jgi:hemin uptake protein HemP